MVALANCGADARTDEGEIVVKPTKLFVGELRRLEPHLRLVTGAVDLDYRGPEVPVTLRIEIWSGGELLSDGDSMTGRLNGPGEASISVREVASADGEARYEVVTALGKNGFSSAVRRLTAPDLVDKARWPMELTAPVTLERNEPLAVWALLVDGFGSQPEGSIDEAAQRVDWALVLRLVVDEQPAP